MGTKIDPSWGVLTAFGGPEPASQPSGPLIPVDLSPDSGPVRGIVNNGRFRSGATVAMCAQT